MALAQEWADEMNDASNIRIRLVLDFFGAHTPKFANIEEAEDFVVMFSEAMRMQRHTVVIGWVE